MTKGKRSDGVTLFKQPELTDNFGVDFQGRAETATGETWWYHKDGRRIPLRPKHVIASS